MFNLVKKVINFQDNLYIIKRTIKETSIKEEFVLEYKEYIGADTVLKKDGLYYFAIKIDEAQIIPETGQLELDF
jgi:hypothetical protein